MSKSITIPKELTHGTEDLVIIPRQEYEEFLRLSVKKSIKEVELTSRQKRALEKSRANMKAGKFFTIDELKQKLGFAD
jgi:hypothetical protein